MHLVPPDLDGTWGLSPIARHVLQLLPLHTALHVEVNSDEASNDFIILFFHLLFESVLVCQFQSLGQTMVHNDKLDELAGREWLLHCVFQSCWMRHHMWCPGNKHLSKLTLHRQHAGRLSPTTLSGIHWVHHPEEFSHDFHTPSSTHNNALLFHWSDISASAHGDTVKRTFCYGMKVMEFITT